MTSCLTTAEETSLPIAGGRIIGVIPFPRVLVLCEMQSVSSKIWTLVAVSISCDDNHYTTGTSTSRSISLFSSSMWLIPLHDISQGKLGYLVMFIFSPKKHVTGCTKLHSTSSKKRSLTRCLNSIKVKRKRPVPHWLPLTQSFSNLVYCQLIFFQNFQENITLLLPLTKITKSAHLKDIS